VQRLLDGFDITEPAGVRDYAILMLVANLACDRSIEAVRLRLDYLNWRPGRIVLRGKASRGDRMPLTADVGDAFSTYLCPPDDPRAPTCKCGRAGFGHHN
jgi:site-specific recombinase XerC